MGSRKDPDPHAKREAAAQRSEKQGDNVHASRRWSELYELAPQSHRYGLFAGRAALAAKDCSRAQRFLAHYLTTADPETEKRRIKEGEALQAQARDECPALDEEESNELARDLYTQGEAFAEQEAWEDALYAYEEAYYLAPTKHGFAYKIGYAAHQMGLCTKAQTFLAHYKSNADRSKHEDWQREADGILNRYETTGCDEAPPPQAGGGCGG